MLAYHIALVIGIGLVLLDALFIVALFRPMRDEVRTWLSDPDDGRRSQLQKVFPGYDGGHK